MSSHLVAAQEGLAIRVERSQRQHLRRGSQLAEGITSRASTRVCGASGEEMIWSSGAYMSMCAAGRKTFWRVKSKGEELKESTLATVSQGDGGSHGLMGDTEIVSVESNHGDGGREVNTRDGGIRVR